MPMKLNGILTFAAAAGFAGAASAADIYQPPPPISSPIYSPAPIFSWTGFYLGVQGGYDWNSVSESTTPFSYSPSGGIAGVYAGYNWQTATNWVFGVDGSINYDWARGTDAFGSGAGPTYKGLFRGRLGYAWDRFMPYVTAGGAVMGYTDGAGSSATPFGWAVGGGVEMAITDNVIGRVDYTYQDYGTFTVGGVATTNKSHTLMGGIALKF